MATYPFVSLPVFQLPGELKDEFLVLPFGRHELVDGGNGFEFTREDAASVMAAFKDRGIEMLADWEHQSIAHLPGFEMFKAPDGRAPAAGWSGNLEARSDGLWATGVRWTSDAVAALKSGAYRYFSPVLIIRHGHVRAIQSIGLTNEPRLKRIPALAARCDLGELLLSLDKESSMPFRDDVAGALGVKADASDQDLLAALKQLKDKAASGETAAGQIAAFKTQADTSGAKVTDLTAQLATVAAAKDAAVADVAKRDTEITALKTQATAQQQALVDTILLFATETGRVAPAAKDQWKTLVEQNPAGALTALKSMGNGSALPVGRITDTTTPPAAGPGAGPKAPASADDHIAACKGVKFDDGRLKVHNDAVEHQKKNPGVTYLEALEIVQRK